MQTEQRPLAGIVMLVSTMFLFAVQDIVIKSFSGDYSVLQIVYARCIVGLSLLLFVLGVRRTVKLSRSQRPRLAFARGLLAFTSYLGYYTAIASLPLAELVAIVFSAPIFVTALSAFVLREQVGWRRWLAVLLGFIGVLIVVGPQGLSSNLGVGLAFLATITYAIVIILTRLLSEYDEPLTITLYSMVMFVLGSIVVSVAIALAWEGSVSHPSLQFLLRDWVFPSVLDLALMCAIGAIWAVGMFGLTKAYCSAPASLLSPFEYISIIWAVLFGYLFWAEVPPASTFLGIAILISSSFYIARREMRVAKMDRVVPAGGVGALQAVRK